MRLIEVWAWAGTLPDALTGALQQLIGPPARSEVEADHSLTTSIRAEAASVYELLPRLTDSLIGLIDDFDAAPAEVSIHGHRWLPDGVRVWGTVTLDRNAGSGPMEIEWLKAPAVEENGDGWLIVGSARITHAQTPQGR